MARITQLKTRVVCNRELAGSYRYLEFESSCIAKAALPGQFVNIRVSGTSDPLLRRPLSIHGIKGRRVKVLYEVVGKATGILASKKPGDSLDILGPLGNGFKLDRAAPFSAKESNIVVAGGMGVAPLVFLAETLKKSKTQIAQAETIVLIGAKTKKFILCRKEFEALGFSVRIATDDGSLGFKGKVTDLLNSFCGKTRPGMIFSCGPRPMLQAVALAAAEKNIPAQLSLEEYMACGIGACLGCVVSTRQGYKTVCKDGPVFFGEDLIW